MDADTVHREFTRATNEKDRINNDVMYLISAFLRLYTKGVTDLHIGSSDGQQIGYLSDGRQTEEYYQWKVTYNKAGAKRELRIQISILEQQDHKIKYSIRVRQLIRGADDEELLVGEKELYKQDDVTAFFIEVMLYAHDIVTYIESH